MPLAPLAVATTIVATRVFLTLANAATILWAASAITEVCKTQIPQAKQGWREARRQRALLKNPRLEHKHGIE